MPRGRERKPLDRAGAAKAGLLATPMPSIGVRRIALPARSGKQRTVEIDPARFRCARLASQLSDQWIEIASGMSRSVVEVQRQALVNYLEYVDEKRISPISLDQHPGAVVASLSLWAKFILTQYDSKSIMPYRMCNIVQTQMTCAMADGVISDEVLAAYVQGPALVEKPRSRPLDEFSKDELQQMVLAARAHVRATRSIRRWAVKTVQDDLAGSISDPSHRCVARMLQDAALGHPVVMPREWNTATLLQHFPAEAWTLYPSPGGAPNKLSAPLWCVRSMLPLERDLTPFRILLLAATGATADEISSLRTSDIEWDEDGIRLQMTKARANRSKGRFFAGTSRNRGWNVPAMVQSLIDYTEPARAIGVMDDHALWMAVSGYRVGENRLPRPVAFGTGTASLAEWVRSLPAEYGLGELSTPHDVRRIRKTKVSERAVNLQGVMGDIAGDDHTTQVFFNHYAHTTTLKVYSANVISRFQTSLADAVKTGFTAFLSHRSKVPLATLTEALPMERAQAASLRSGALDMGVADCQDPFDSPFTQKGKLCGSAPVSCLSCENAVVFTDHLPNIFALVSAMEAARRSLGPEEWIAVWGAQYDAAQALLAALPENVRASAQRRAEDTATDLPIWMQGGDR